MYSKYYPSGFFITLHETISLKIQNPAFVFGLLTLILTPGF